MGSRARREEMLEERRRAEDDELRRSAAELAAIEARQRERFSQMSLGGAPHGYSSPAPPPPPAQQPPPPHVYAQSAPAQPLQQVRASVFHLLLIM
jgi:hypothetical protein